MKKLAYKSISFLLSFCIMLGCVGLISSMFSLKASAATAGSYYVKITFNVSNAGNFEQKYCLNNAANWGNEANDAAGVTIKYRTDNGTGTTYGYYSWDIGNSEGKYNGNTSGLDYEWAGNLANSSGEHTLTATLGGFPVGFYSSTDDNRAALFGGNTKITYTKIEVGSSSSNLTTVWTGSAYHESQNKWKSTYIYQSTDYGTDTNASDSTEKVETTSKTWDMPAATTIGAISGVTSVDVPFTGTTQKSYTVGVVKDQYGVNWHEDATLSMPDTNNCTFSNGTLSVPAAANRSADYNVTITASCGDASKTKTVTIKVFYIITFENYNGDELQTLNYRRGDTPAYSGATPTRPADVQYTYAFSEWTPAITTVTGSATYTAAYSTTTNKYDITWKNDDGSVIRTDSVEYGTVPSFGSEDPVKAPTEQYSYDFAGWEPAVTSVAGAAEYTATYTPVLRTYTVLWKNWDGTILETDENVAYGTTPEFNSAQPSRETTVEASYTFNGWTPAVGPITGDTIYTAKYISTPIEYTITWYNYDGTLLLQKDVAYNTFPSYTGSTPAKPYTGVDHYTFSGWSPSLTKVTGEATYTAQFNEAKHAITYYNDGETHHGECACGYTTPAQAHVKGPDGRCVLCGSDLADYTEVDEAIASVPKPVYFTDESYATVLEAVNNVERGLVDGRQSEVDAMAYAIKAAIDNLEVKQYNVTVPQGCTVVQQNAPQISKYYKIAMIKAPASYAGSVFTYWADEDGNPVTTYLTYYFIVTEDVSYHPVYGANKNDALYVSRVSAIRDNGDDTYSIVVDHSVSSTTSIIGHGVIVTSNPMIGNDEQQMLISNNSVEKYAAFDTNSTRTGVLEVVTELESGTYYCRSYIQDEDNVVHYGDIQQFEVGSGTPDSFGEIIAFDMIEAAVDMNEEEAPAPAAEEPEEPSESLLTTIINFIIELVQKIVAYIKLVPAIIK